MDLYNTYRNAILEYAALYNGNAMIEMNDDVFSYLSTLLTVDKSELKYSYQKGVINPRNHFSYSLFSNYILQYMITDIRKNMIFSKKYHDVIENFGNYLYIIGFINSISSNITTVLSMKRGSFCYDKILETFSRDRRESKSLKLLELFRVEKFYDAYKDFLPIVYSLIEYEIDSFQNLLFFMNALVILYDSELLHERYKMIAERLMDRFFVLFRSARIISCRINSHYHDLSIPFDQRNVSDNTTLLQVFYCYPNTDTFSLRLDLPHKGVPYIHFNNISPGKTKCFLFSESEYKEMIKNYPELESCFIQYSNVYSLKERDNCPTSKEIMEMYDECCKRYDHNAVFSTDVNEEEVTSFFEIMHYMLPDNCCSPIENEDKFVDCFFNYTGLMGYYGLTGLIHAMFDDKSYQTMIEWIITKALHLGVIQQDEKDEYMNLEGIELIVSMVKENTIKQYGPLI